MTGICGVGDNVVDRYVHRGTLYPGGNAVNVAVHARRCGSAAAYVGALGDDTAGQLILRALESEEVETTRTRVVRGPNAYALVRLVDGDRVFDPGSVGVSEFTLTGADLAYLSGFSLIHTGDCSFLERQLPELAGVGRVSFDFSNRPREYAEPLLPSVDIATFSAGHLGAREVTDLIAWAHGLGPRTVIATRGAAGALVSDGTTIHEEGARPDTAVVDTLGAGDAFVASMLVQLLSGTAVPEALRTASVYARQTCGYYGAFGYESADLLPPPRPRESDGAGGAPATLTVPAR